MNLALLLESLKADQACNPLDDVRGDAAGQEIGTICYDSRQAGPGSLFVAMPGSRADGHDYASQAVSQGAAAVVAEKDLPTGGAVLIRVRDSRRALAAMSACFYGHPSKRLQLIGITGTNGKTTVSYMVEAILNAAGKKTGVIGTINTRWPGKMRDSQVTTPESLDLQRTLADMAAAGVTHAVIEVSSHALSQGRVRFCHFDAAVFTNISQDHLDYHGGMDAYFAAKSLLFYEHLAASEKPSKTAVINMDDVMGARLCKEAAAAVLCTGLTEGCNVRAFDVQSGAGGLSGAMETPAGDLAFRSEAVGRHNLYNLMSAAGVGLAMGLGAREIEQGLNSAVNVPGRLESIANKLDRHVFVDYAHTPDALENVLGALKRIAQAKIITVFGCGGDRDRDKRPKMGAAAARYSDLVVVTSDNPRSENPDSIIAQALKGLEGSGMPCISAASCLRSPGKKSYMVEPDRRRAILAAIMASGPGDIVLIAGKGHETYQIIADKKLIFDDRIEARNALDCLARNLKDSGKGGAAA